MIDKFNPSQLNVISSESNLSVVAGAGSGKTGTLVELLTRFLENSKGESVTNILALTFSDKAATEMRGRLGRSFRDRMNIAKSIEDAEVEKTKKPAKNLDMRFFWEKQLRHLGQAEIGTIHSYALGLVRNYAYLLGLSTNVNIDGVSADQTDDLDEVVLDLLAEKQPDLISLLKVTRLRSSMGGSLMGWLRSCIGRLSGWGLDRLEAMTDSPFLDVDACLEELRKSVDGALNYVTEVDPSVGGKYASVPPALEALVELLEFKGPPDLSKLVKSLLEPSRGLSRWRKTKNQSFKDDINGLIQKLLNYQSFLWSIPVKTNLSNLLELIPARIRKRRLARGTVDFDDILNMARRLLRENQIIRQQEHDKYHLLVIDEFQDTNRLQADLLAQLLIDPQKPSCSWSELKWEELPSRLKVFGDPKQSIYRFRGSEPIIMNDLCEQLNKDGQVLNLDTNYRTQEGLIGFFNDFFSKYINPYENQKTSRGQLYDIESVNDTRPLVWLSSGPKQKIADNLSVQARLVTEYLKILFTGEAGVLVSDKSGNTRLPRPGDVAILLRRKKNAALFEEAIFQAGFPCHTLKGQDIFEAQEIKGLAAAYLYLADYEPDLNLAIALASPLGPVNDDTLNRLVWPQNHNAPLQSLSYYFQSSLPPWPELDADQTIILTEIRNLLLTLKPFVHRRPPGEILESLVESRCLLPLIIGGPEGSTERVKQVQTFLSLVKTLPYHDPYAPGSSADYLRSLLLSGHETGEESDGGEVEETDNRAINIMTVHKSKGLEYPVIIIPEADVNYRQQNNALFISDDGRYSFTFNLEDDRSFKVTPPDYTEIQDQEKENDLAEHQRLFYVAATRARDHLVLVGSDNIKDTDTSWLSQVINKADKKYFRKVEPELVSGPGVADKYLNLKEKVEIKDNVSQNLGEGALIEPIKPDRSLFVSVTSYCQKLVSPEFSDDINDDDDGEIGQTYWSKTDGAAIGPDGPTSPRERGILFHAVMEKTCFDLDRASLGELLEQQATRLGFEPNGVEQSFFVDKLLEFQESEYGRELLAVRLDGGILWREWPFWLRLEKDEKGNSPVILTGVVDLFYVVADGRGQIVDYKMSRPGHLAVYEKQVELYKIAVEKAGFSGPIKTKLWFAGEE